MPTYVLMTKLTPTVMNQPGKRKEYGREWKETVDRLCPGVRWVAHYALLGPYDFMDIYEAPDAETAARVSLITHATGAQKAESWPAVPYGRFVEIAQEVGKAL
ncbi:MAG: GYD domain-containing protein [Deltaproteobacteria bacterium]|nr:GYD domain-containing protein [Deltaproteobacteria bacterium]